MKLKEIIATVVVAISCLSMEVIGEVKDIEVKEIAEYPFYSDPERSLMIKNRYSEIKLGMYKDQVVAILGVPDEVRYVFEPRMKSARKIGYSHWFVIERLVKNGSVKELNESLFRVIYNFQDIVGRVDEWGLDDTNQK